MTRISKEEGRPTLEFEKEFFDARRYKNKERMVKRHVLKVLEWASDVVGDDLLRGEGRKALDVGCACGYSSQVLDLLGYDTCAVDLSRWGVRQAKQSVRGYFLVCDAQSELPFKDGIFDLVTCFDVLEHLQFPVNAIQHMLRICDGTLVCTTPNKTVEKPVRKIMGDYDESHISAKSASEWEKSIKDNADVKMLKVETFLDLTSKLLGERMFFKSFKLPSLGLTVRIVARK